MEKEGKTSSKKIMVAIDLSESSYQALIWVLENLKELITECPLILFATQPLLNCNYVVGASMGFAWVQCPLSATIALTLHNQERNRKDLLEILEKARRICSKRGFLCSVVNLLALFSSRRSCSYAVQFVRSSPRCPVREVQPAPFSPCAILPCAPNAPSSSRILRRSARAPLRAVQLLLRAVQFLPAFSVKVETYLGECDPKEDICNAVKQHSINLLVIGHSLKRSFMGILGNHCLNEAKCPVLVVNKPQ